MLVGKNEYISIGYLILFVTGNIIKVKATSTPMFGWPKKKEGQEFYFVKSKNIYMCNVIIIKVCYT